MKICITGATGFIGSYMISFLYSNYFNTIVTKSKKYSNYFNCNILELNSKNIYNLDGSVFKNYDVLIHLAGCTTSKKRNKYEQLCEYRKVNRDLTISLAKLAANSGVKRFVFLSSIKVNGETTKKGNSFTDNLDSVPTDYYGLSKYEAEKGLFEIAKKTSMEIVVIRPPLVYGPGVKGNFARLISWTKRVISLPFALVDNRRSFISLYNLVDFILLCADSKKSLKAANQIFVISDGEDISLPDMVKKISTAYRTNLVLLPVPIFLMKILIKVFGKPNIIKSLFDNLQINNEKAYKLLGWRPIITLDEQLQIMAKHDKKVKY